MADSDVQGPVVICVGDHDRAESLRGILSGMFRPKSGETPEDQGFIVLPFAASPLAYCGGGTRSFRAMVSIPPRPGQSITRVQFNAWVDTVAPYLATGAERLVL